MHNVVDMCDQADLEGLQVGLHQVDWRKKMQQQHPLPDTALSVASVWLAAQPLPHALP